jgi:hypothetical protein
MMRLRQIPSGSGRVLEKTMTKAKTTTFRVANERAASRNFTRILGFFLVGPVNDAISIRNIHLGKYTGVKFTAVRFTFLIYRQEKTHK